MARKDRNLASFDDVASNNIKPNINVDVNNNDNTKINNNDNFKINNKANTIDGNDINADINQNDNISIDKDVNDKVNNDIIENPETTEAATAPKMDYLDKLINGKTKKIDNSTVLTGIYLQKDLAQLLDRLAKKGGRGAKSRIVNEALRSVFIEKGLL
jgi:hypothetical protein